MGVFFQICGGLYKPRDSAVRVGKSHNSMWTISNRRVVLCRGFLNSPLRSWYITHQWVYVFVFYNFCTKRFWFRNVFLGSGVLQGTPEGNRQHVLSGQVLFSSFSSLYFKYIFINVKSSSNNSQNILLKSGQYKGLCRLIKQETNRKGLNQILKGQQSNIV